MDEQQRRLAEELLFSEEKKGSFAKMLYFGICDSAKVFPYPEPSEEEKKQVELYLAQVTSFADTHLHGEEIDRTASIPESVIQNLGRLGLLGLTIPKAYQGLGMSQYAYCKAAETIARYCSSTALFMNAHQSIGLKALVLFGTAEQKEHWLPSLARGDKIAAFALTEPNAGSDASGIETRAVYDAEKKVYRITGKKQWITNGGFAGMLTVMAKTEVDTAKGKQDKITAFIVSPDMPGFTVEAAALDKVGMRGSKTSILSFKQVEVPETHILGPLGGGLKVCLTVLDYGRTTFGATCTGVAKVLLDKALQHAHTRYQFKQPLSAFPLVKQKLAMIAGLTYAMDASTYLTAGLLDSQEEDIMLEAAMLKVFASDSLWKIIYETMQIYGGRSFFTDQPFERMMRDARLNMIGEGSNEVLRAFIGVVGMRDVGMELKDFTKLLSHPFNGFSCLKKLGKHCIHRFFAQKIPLQSPQLFPEGKKFEKSVRKFGFAILRLLSKYRENVIDKQLELDRIATSAMALYTTAAVLSKLDQDIQKKRIKAGMQAAARLYCQQALDQLDSSLGSLHDRRDDSIEETADLLIKDLS